jgi:uncharacterized membrane protein YbhN (UPF0104 family)
MSTNQSSANRYSFGAIVRVAGTVVAVALMVWLLAQQDWAEILGNIEQIGMTRFLLAVALLMASRIAISLRWYSLLRGAGENISYWASLKITFAGLFANNFLPSTVGGDGIRLAGGVQASWNGAVVAASLVMDRLVGMFGMATFLPFSLPKVLGYYRLSMLEVSPVLAFSGVGTHGEPEGSLPQKLFWRVKEVLFRIWQTIVLWVRRPRTLVLPILYNYAHVLLTFAMIWVMLQGLGNPISYLEAGGLWAAVYFISLLPISIGGLGLQEWAIWFAFHQIGGINEAHSLTLALLYRTLMMFSSLPGAAFVSGIIERRKQEIPGEPS